MPSPCAVWSARVLSCGLDAYSCVCDACNVRAARVFTLTVGVALSYTAPAAASTVFLAPSDAFPQQDAVKYVADSGEANRVTIASVDEPSAALEITDAGATIRAGSGCTSLAPNRARCSYPAPAVLEADLADGDDSLSSPTSELSARFSPAAKETTGFSAAGVNRGLCISSGAQATTRCAAGREKTSSTAASAPIR